jgi:hypothetical protein
MQLHEVTLRAGVTKVCLSPRKPFVAVASLKSGSPVAVDLSQEQPTVTALDSIDLTGNPESSDLFLSAISDEFYDVYSDAYYDTGTP